MTWMGRQAGLKIRIRTIEYDYTSDRHEGNLVLWVEF